MDAQRKKQLIAAYKNRKPQMGIIVVRSLKTDAVFFSISKDIPADFNSNRFKLSMNTHPNKALQGLWNELGSSAFEFSVAAQLKEDTPAEKQDTQLQELLETFMLKHPNAKKIWR